jgi:hypothetical protein
MSVKIISYRLRNFESHLRGPFDQFVTKTGCREGLPNRGRPFPPPYSPILFATISRMISVVPPMIEMARMSG